MVDVSSNFIGKIDVYSRRLEKFLWPASTAIDYECTTHYVFKPLPTTLKANQINEWAKLQLKTLTPFPAGDAFYYVSKLGLHAWFSTAEISGIPETAAQDALPNGTHRVKGRVYSYQQHWQNGALIESIQLPNYEEDSAIELTFEQPWATNNKLKAALSKPKSCLILFAIVFGFAIAYLSTAWLIISIQASNYTSSTETLQNQLGEKLNIVTEFREKQSALDSIKQWNTQGGSLPSIVALAIESVLAQTTWNARSIVWQNNTASIELIAPSIDIAALVSSIEQQSMVADVEIRPAEQSGAWILEITAK